MTLHFKKMGDGPALLILHGLLGSGDNWQSLAREWEKKYTVYLIDARNHGHSPHSDAFNFDLMAEDLKNLMAEEKIDTCHLLGHSMGGKTAMHFALQYPEKIDKLIIADIGTKAYAAHHDDIFEALLSVDFDTHNSRSAVDKQLAKHIKQVGVRQFLMKNLYWVEKGKLAWRFNLEAIHKHYHDIIGAIPKGTYRGDVLFIRGAESGYIQDKDWNDIKTQFTTAQLHSIKNAGHWVHAEKPHDVLGAVEEFLKN